MTSSAMTTSTGTTKIFFDGDPANDDALAILVAAGHPSIDLVGVTAVAGHLVVEGTALNSAIAVAMAGATDVPVAAGAALPLVRDQILAQVLDHADGLDRLRDDLPAVDLHPGHGVDLMVDTLRANPGTTLVATGPLTNVAMALRKDPGLVDVIDSIVILGGAWGLGNKSAAAEFNVLCDPEAAAIVYGSGARIVMVPVDATATVPITTELVEQVQALEGDAAQFAAELMRSLRTTHGVGPGPLGKVAESPVHDPTAVLVAVDPSLATTLRARVDIETQGRHTYGRSVIDFAGKSGLTPNADVVVELDAPRIHQMLIDSLGRLNRSATSKENNS